jgi:hypothetical protein
MKRIKHNDLLPWFTQDHNTLPASYIKKCKEFFGEVAQEVTSGKPQATSGKRRAVISNKEVTSLKRSELMKFLQWHYSQNYLKSLSIEDLRRLYKDWQKHHNVI